VLGKMAKLILLIKWLFKMWPVFLPAAFAGLHYIVYTTISSDLSHANKVISLVLQLVGGILVLYSIDSNLGIMNNTSLLSLFLSYIKNFPLIKRSYTLKADSGTIKMTGHIAKLRVGGPTITIDEKIDHLQKQITWLKEDLNDEVKGLKGMVHSVEKKANASISEIRSSIGSIDRKVQELSAGGIKTQIFGVLLMIHGSVSSYYA
jgi:hypothetical protein